MVGVRKTIGGANCRLESDGTVQCDFGPRDPAERQRSGNPGPGCYVNTGTGRWECPSMPELHGQPADINAVHRDPTTGQTWASVGERKIQVPSFPVSVGRSRSRLVPSFTGRKRGAPDNNPMTVARGGIAFSPPATSQLYSRVSNAHLRRSGRLTRSGTGTVSRPCRQVCQDEYGFGTAGYNECVATRCSTIGVPDPKPGAGGKGAGRRTRRRRRNQPGTAAPTGSIASTITEGPRTPPGNGNGDPSGPGNKWMAEDGTAAGCCVFIDGQGAYLTCDPMSTGGNHPLHGLEVQVQDVHEAEGLATVCHPSFTEGCWRVPLCPEEKTPSQCCVELGQFERDGITFTGRLKCTDPNDPLHGILVMTGQPYDKNGEQYVGFDVAGDVSAELPVCVKTPPVYIPPDEEEPGPECCVIENGDGTFTLVCAPDPHGWNGLVITDGQCMDTQMGRMCALEFVDAAGNQVQIEAPVCDQPPDIERPPQCCVDATTTPPTLQQCNPPEYNGTPVDILDVDEESGQALVAVPWSSVPVPLPLCDEPPDKLCPECPECPECPPDRDCPRCPPGHWMGPDGSCVQCPPGQLIDPTTGQCVRCPPQRPPGECPECPPGTYLDTATGQCVRCPDCPESGECPECPPCRPCPPDGRIPPPWECCDDDEDCIPSRTPRLPHFPPVRPVPGCDPDDPCCYDCSVNGGGTVSNPCNPCRANRR